jgi:hypothetical protein
LSGRGVVTAGDLRRRLEISSPTLSRLVAQAGDAIVRIGRGRKSSYARVRPLASLPRRIPVFRVDADGEPQVAATWTPLDRGATWVTRQGDAEPDGHLHAGLPPVAHDMAPAGYLGRSFPEQHSDLGLPARLQDWSDDHRLIAIARRGEDTTGDLIVGEESLQRFLDSAPVEATERDYPRIAEATVHGASTSSPAGEQPKLTAYVGGRHVLVKFTAGDGSASELRWRDLLVCEALALETLARGGLGAPRARIVDVGTRRFLEVERFDRIGARGRVGVVTLGPIDDDVAGGRDSWGRAAMRLCALGLLSRDDGRRVQLLEAFAILIANSDRHFGNIAFFADGLEANPPLRLAPAYDMLPMMFAPSAGVLPRVARPAVTPRAELIDVWKEAAALASEYWAAIAIDSRVSEAFRAAVSDADRSGLLADTARAQSRNP